MRDKQRQRRRNRNRHKDVPRANDVARDRHFAADDDSNADLASAIALRAEAAIGDEARAVAHGAVDIPEFQLLAVDPLS